MLDFLSRTWVLFVLFAAMMAIGFSFSYVQIATGGALLDTLFTSAEASTRLAEMSAEQKRAHLSATLLNDTAYPLATAGFFVGMIWRFAGGLKRWFTLAPIALLIIDMTENLSQTFALMGNESFLGLKDVLTPAKFGMFALASALVLVSVVLAIIHRIRAD